MKAWIRQLQVTLTSTTIKKSITFSDEIGINITGTKYLAATKDTFTIELKNVDYNTTLLLIKGSFLDIEIKAGYRDSGLQTVFKGAVIYMSYDLADFRTTKLIILAGSNLVAKYGQSKINLTLNSSINMYSALKFICKRAGITDANIYERLKLNINKGQMSMNTNIANYLESICDANNLVINSDASNGSTTTIFPMWNANARIWKMTEDNTVFVGSYPRVTSDGLTMTILPTYNLMPMDTIVIDNALINISVTSTNAADYNASFYLDDNDQYVIIELGYNLANRDDTFEVNVFAKAKKFYTNVNTILGRN